MKTFPLPRIHFRELLLASALVGGAGLNLWADQNPSAGAASAKKSASSATAIGEPRIVEMDEAEIKAALSQIDVELRRMASLLAATPTTDEAADSKIRYNLLRERRVELEKDFTRPRYEAFLSDLEAEKKRIAAAKKEVSWTAPTGESSASEQEVVAQLPADAEAIRAKIDAVIDAVRPAALREGHKMPRRYETLAADF